MYEMGSSVYDDWKIIKKIGSGSFGRVYRIERTNFGQTYTAALKVISIPGSIDELRQLRADYASDDAVKKHLYEQVKDLVQEITLMSKLKGTGYIVSYEDHKVIPHPNGIGWDILIRMELLTPFCEYLETHSFTQRDVVQLGIDICKALEMCQTHNIIHRDVKPDNIFVNAQGGFKLGDFGIARQLEKTLRGEMSLKGTYSYMAPEIYREDTRYGYNVDTYSLGIVLYKLLNKNRGPFLPAYPNEITVADREDARLRRMRGEPLPSPANGKGRLGDTVLKACAYEPSARYESAYKMRKALEGILFVVDEVEQIIPGSGVARMPIELEDNRTYLSEEVNEDYSTHLENSWKEDQETRLTGASQEKECTQKIGIQQNTKKRRKAPVIFLVLFLVIASVSAGLFGAFYVSEKKTSEMYSKYIYDAKACRESNPERAMELYLAAQNLLPEEETGYLGYAYALYLSRDYDKAISYIEGDLGLGKQFSLDAQSELCGILASAYFETDEFAKAASFFALSGNGRPTSGYALCNYAVSLGRLGDYEAADSVMEQMIADGATGAEITYVQAEIAYAQNSMTSAESAFLSVLSSTDDLALQRRTLRSLANLYLDCVEMDHLGFSTIADPGTKGIEILEKGIVEYNLQYDHSILELLAKMYYEAYLLDEENRKPYLGNSAELFERIMDMGVKKDYYYQNLYNIYYLLQDYDNAENILQEYKTMYPKDYAPYAMRTILLMTLEGNKPVSERNYASVYDEFNTAEILSEHADDLGYYYNAKYYMDELTANGWDNFQIRQNGIENESSEEPKEGVYNPADNPYTVLTVGKVEEDGFYFHYLINDEVFCSHTKATLEDDVYTFLVYYGSEAIGNQYVGLAGSIRFLNDGTVEFVVTDSPHQGMNGTTIFTYTGELSDEAKYYFEEGLGQ